MPVTATTDLPDAEGLQLDASIEDELTAEWTDVLNNGEYRVEYRDDDPDGDHPPYQLAAEVDEATTAHTITGLLDGEQYSVRIRTQTQYKTGNWLEAESITKFPAPDSLTVPSTSPTSISLDWAEYADNEVGSKIFRARIFDNVVESFEQIGTTDANDTSFVDDGVLPQREYRYFAREYTEWVYADTASIDETADATGKPTTRIPAQGWYIEIDHPSGATHRPSVLDDGAQVVPRVNGLPRVRVPVPKSEKWQADTFELTDVRIWKDGKRQPAEVLLDVEQQPGRTVLVCRGGEALRDRVDVEYDNRPVHEVVGELLADTPYTATVDEPVATETDQIVQAPSTESEWLEVLQEVDLSTLPLAVENGGPTLQQSCYVREAENADRNNSGLADSTEYSGGFAEKIAQSSHYLEFDFTPQYTIPSEHVGALIPGTGSNDFLESEIILEVDGAEYVLDSYSGGQASGRGWYDAAADGRNSDPYDGPDLTAGETVTLIIEAAGTSGTEYGVDVVAVADQRYDYTLDSTVHQDGGYCDGPELYPVLTVRLNVFPTVQSVIGAELTADFSSTAGEQAVGVTNDGDDALVTASNTETISTDFGSRTGEIQAELTLSRHPLDQDPQSATPRYGYEGQSVASMELTARVDDMPLVLNRRLYGRLVDVLRELAEDLSDSVFAVDLQADGTGVVEWAQREQRTTTVDASLADFELVTTRDPIERAVVRGANQTVRREALTADHGTAVALQNERLSEGSVDVYDPESLDSFERGEDFEVSRKDGTITTLADGAIADGATVRVDYEYQTEGSYTLDGVDPAAANTEDADISGLTTDRACGQAARRIVETGKKPRHELTATWPADAELPPVVEALDVDGLPVDTVIQTNQVEATPSEIVTTGGSRRPVADVITEINERVSSISRRV